MPTKFHALLRNNNSCKCICPDPPQQIFYFYKSRQKNIFRIVLDNQIKKNLGTCRERIGLAVPRSKHHCRVGVDVYGQAFGSESTSLSYCYSWQLCRLLGCTVHTSLSDCCAYMLLQLLPSTCPGSHASSQLP